MVAMPSSSLVDGAGGEPPLDLRARRKLRTRRALQQAALYLFAEQGYEETKVADIAARAEVGLRTFFLHFPTKEAVLFNGSRESFEGFARLIRLAPKELSDFAALEYALVQLHQSLSADREMHHEMTKLLVKAAAASSVVRGRRMENADKITGAAIKALAKRRGERTPSLATVTLAEAAMRTHHLAVTEWASSATEDLIPIFRRRFRVLREVMTDPTRAAAWHHDDEMDQGEPGVVQGARALLAIE
jgi:AcrR family transcriptional regulator